MKKTVYFLAFFIAVVGFASCGTTKLVDNRPVKVKVESQRYKFLATYAIPTSAEFQPKHLTSVYDLKVTPDTIVAFLPYFGRAYEAPLDASEGGIKFTSAKFDYQMLPGRKAGNWIVNIRINDQRREIFMTLNIWDNGKADLNVWDQTKQSISFQGELE